VSQQPPSDLVPISLPCRAILQNDDLATVFVDRFRHWGTGVTFGLTMILGWDAGRSPLEDAPAEVPDFRGDRFAAPPHQLVVVRLDGPDGVHLASSLDEPDRGHGLSLTYARGSGRVWDAGYWAETDWPPESTWQVSVEWAGPGISASADLRLAADGRYGVVPALAASTRAE
jgi:hypothetical protein